MPEPPRVDPSAHPQGIGGSGEQTTHDQPCWGMSRHKMGKGT